MTKSEYLCKQLGELYFFKELVKCDLVYITEEKEEKELADALMRVGNFILAIQIKEKEKNEGDIQKWLENKVYRIAKNQTKKTYNQIKQKINFKHKNNEDILENVDQCTIIPIILFDLGGKNIIDYNREYQSSSSNIVINIFDIKDFQLMCNTLISPMEIIRYMHERVEYIHHKILICEDDEKIIIGKSNNENAMLNYYNEKYELNHSSTNIEKLGLFNNYLTLFENHCISNKNQYKVFIKYLSRLYTKEIYYFVERLNYIIKIGFNKLMYWNSYIISEDKNILFVSLPKEKYNIEFISLLSQVFMYNFKINKVLTIINYAIDGTHYELDFAICEYDNNSEDLYIDAIKDGMASVWNKDIEEIV